MYRVVKFSDGAYFMFGNDESETSCSCPDRGGCRKYRGSEGRRMAFLDAKRWGGKVYLVTTRAELRDAAADITQVMPLALGHIQRRALSRARKELRKKAGTR